MVPFPRLPLSRLELGEKPESKLAAHEIECLADTVFIDHEIIFSGFRIKYRHKKSGVASFPVDRLKPERDRPLGPVEVLLMRIGDSVPHSLRIGPDDKRLSPDSVLKADRSFRFECFASACRHRFKGTVKTGIKNRFGGMENKRT